MQIPYVIIEELLGAIKHVPALVAEFWELVFCRKRQRLLQPLLIDSGE